MDLLGGKHKKCKYNFSFIIFFKVRLFFRTSSFNKWTVWSCGTRCTKKIQIYQSLNPKWNDKYFQSNNFGKISFELQSCNYFALIVDETKDISKTEQLSVVVPYYIQDSIHEWFLDYEPDQQLNASSLLNYIKAVLKNVWHRLTTVLR